MESSCSFDFSAPQFVESLSEAATLAEQDGADKFFDSDTFSKTIEDEETEIFKTPLAKNVNKDDGEESELLEEYNNERCNGVNTAESNENQPSSRVLEERLIIKATKKSQKNLNPDEKHIRQEMCRFDGIILPMNSEKDKEHAMMTRQDKVIKTPVMELRTRQIVREAKKRKASPKLEDVCFNRKQASKFMTLAEKIMHFHEDTPPRFKTKFTSLEEKENRNILLKPTVPHSPKLMTKSRIRSVENMTTEDQQKYVFKASKLNMKIFEKPDNNVRAKAKSPIKPKLFTSTEVSKTEISTGVFQFQGKSKCKQYGSAHSLNSSITSNCSNRSRRRIYLRSVKGEHLLDEDDAYSGMTCLTKSNRSTQLQPFSFDERDKEILKKKEEKIKKLQEEMSKVPVFHATPVPSFVSNQMKSAASTMSLFSDTSSMKGELRCSDSEMSNCDTTFKAKFPAVLYKEPFVPQKPERPLLETNNIELNTEIRARKRQEFEKDLKLKEEMREQERKEVMALIEQIEKEKLSELRKNLVHKAQPIPKYPPVQKER
ncbi:meiotic 38 isoform X2 [Rhodnius prolixus]|uniref:meiotic 38 isoform X2 n=1 Tax=Rhodnius prolixus TaxID=13249 RepID=UPI003D18ABF3